MVTAAVQFKVMPESPDTNLEELKAKIKETVESFESGVFNSAEEVPIAFGLKSITVVFAIPESQETDAVEAAIKELPGVSSVELLDYRRAIG